MSSPFCTQTLLKIPILQFSGPPDWKDLTDPWTEPSPTLFLLQAMLGQACRASGGDAQGCVKINTLGLLISKCKLISGIINNCLFKLNKLQRTFWSWKSLGRKENECRSDITFKSQKMKGGSKENLIWLWIYEISCSREKMEEDILFCSIPTPTPPTNVTVSILLGLFIENVTLFQNWCLMAACPLAQSLGCGPGSLLKEGSTVPLDLKTKDLHAAVRRETTDDSWEARASSCGPPHKGWGTHTHLSLLQGGLSPETWTQERMSTSKRWAKWHQKHVYKLGQSGKGHFACLIGATEDLLYVCKSQWSSPWFFAPSNVCLICLKTKCVFPEYKAGLMCIAKERKQGLSLGTHGSPSP